MIPHLCFTKIFAPDQWARLIFSVLWYCETKKVFDIFLWYPPIVYRSFRVWQMSSCDFDLFVTCFCFRPWNLQKEKVNAVVQFFSCRFRESHATSWHVFISLIYNTYMRCHRKYVPPTWSGPLFSQRGFIFPETFFLFCLFRITFFSTYFGVFWFSEKTPLFYINESTRFVSKF